ncbi:MAG: ABC transporter permease, partial [Chloroflexota bacterium]
MAQVTTPAQEQAIWRKALDAARSIPPIYVVFILLFLSVGYLNPTFVEPSGFLNFLRRAAPLAVLTAGQLFVIVSGGFDLSVGSLMSLMVIGGSLLINNDPANTWWTIMVLFAIGTAIGVL